MSEPKRTVTVSILDKDYEVACSAEQEAELVASASYLDVRMRSIRDSGKIIGPERIAVMAALNLSHELLHADAEANNRARSSVEELTRKVDQAVLSLRQVEIG